MSLSIRWFGRAWFQIMAQDKVLYVDPAYAKTYLAGLEARSGELLEKLEKAGLVLVTHSHADHCKAATIEKLRRADTLTVAPRRCARRLGGDVRIVEPGGEIEWEGVTVRAVDAYNFERLDGKHYHRKGSGVGYVIAVEGRTIYHAGDTDFIPQMKELGSIDVALLPIGGKFTMDIPEAVEAAIAINPRIVIPMHTLRADPGEFKDKLEARSSIEVVLLQIGEVYHPDGGVEV